MQAEEVDLTLVGAAVDVAQAMVDEPLVIQGGAQGLPEGQLSLATRTGFRRVPRDHVRHGSGLRARSGHIALVRFLEQSDLKSRNTGPTRAETAYSHLAAEIIPATAATQPATAAASPGGQTS